MPTQALKVGGTATREHHAHLLSAASGLDGLLLSALCRLGLALHVLLRRDAALGLLPGLLQLLLWCASFRI